MTHVRSMHPAALSPDVVMNTGGVVPLMLEQPVQLAPGTDYTLVLRIKGPG
jgi:hypothetical protein